MFFLYTPLPSGFLNKLSYRNSSDRLEKKSACRSLRFRLVPIISDGKEKFRTFVCVPLPQPVCFIRDP